MYCFNGIGRSICVPERPLEPPDCWLEQLAEPYEREYDREEEELSGRLNRS